MKNVVSGELLSLASMRDVTDWGLVKKASWHSWTWLGSNLSSLRLVLQAQCGCCSRSIIKELWSTEGSNERNSLWFGINQNCSLLIFDSKSLFLWSSCHEYESLRGTEVYPRAFTSMSSNGRHVIRTLLEIEHTSIVLRLFEVTAASFTMHGKLGLNERINGMVMYSPKRLGDVEWEKIKYSI